MSGKRYSLAFEECPEHGMTCISLNEAAGGGIRLTPGKCCGHWVTVRTFHLKAHQLREIANELTEAAEQMEAE